MASITISALALHIASHPGRSHIVPRGCIVYLEQVDGSLAPFLCAGRGTCLFVGGLGAVIREGGWTSDGEAYYVCRCRGRCCGSRPADTAGEAVGGILSASACPALHLKVWYVSEDSGVRRRGVFFLYLFTNSYRYDQFNHSEPNSELGLREEKGSLHSLKP